jgi:hypothetical protein
VRRAHHESDIYITSSVRMAHPTCETFHTAKRYLLVHTISALALCTLCLCGYAFIQYQILEIKLCLQEYFILVFARDTIIMGAGMPAFSSRVLSH